MRRYRIPCWLVWATYWRSTSEKADQATEYPPFLQHAISLQFPGETADSIFEEGDYAKIFAIVEIMHANSGSLDFDRKKSLQVDTFEAFRLSGSVYQFKGARVELVLNEDMAKKLSATQTILSPYQSSYKTFFNAVGDLVGRRKPTKDIIKDLFVGAEGYLKELTGENDFGDATKALAKKGILNPIQKAIMDKLYGYRSDADGVAHSGNTNAPGEVDALWFLETLLAQISLIHKKMRG